MDKEHKLGDLRLNLKGQLGVAAGYKPSHSETHMPEFKSWDSYRKFACDVMHKACHCHSSEIREFFETVLATSANRRMNIVKDTAYWRARLMSEVQDRAPLYKNGVIPEAYSRDCMFPLANAVTEGRINVKGAPCLYLATNPETAMSEVRPSKGEYISVAEFTTVKDYVLIDCSVEHNSDYPFHVGEPRSTEKEKSVWRDIDRSFSKPASRGESSVDYVPTQMLAEWFRVNQFDGIYYKSQLGAGYNVALFDVKGAKCLEPTLHWASEVKFEFKEEKRQ